MWAVTAADRGILAAHGDYGKEVEGRNLVLREKTNGPVTVAQPELSRRQLGMDMEMGVFFANPDVQPIPPILVEIQTHATVSLR